MKRAVIYTRVSKDDTGEGRSNARQEEACRALCALRGWTVELVEADISISAYSGKTRPAWERVKKMVQSGEVDIVVAWHLDRMTRSMIELEQLIVLAEKRGVGIATVSGDIDLTTDVGRMVARILAAVARAEVERKAERQRLANAQRAKAGVPYTGGAVPFGYTRERAVVPAEAEALREGAAMVLQGVSLKAVAERWTSAGLLPRRQRGEQGGAWTTTGVRGVLLSPRYIGARNYKGQLFFDGQWPALLDEQTHEALTVLLTDPGRKRGSVKAGREPQNLLTGIARCAKCDGTLRASSIRGRAMYSCQNGYELFVPREECDEYVSDWILELLSRPGIVDELLRESTGEDPMAEIHALRARLEVLERQAEDAGEDVDIEFLARSAKRVKGRLAEAQRKLAQSQGAGLVSELSSLATSGQIERAWVGIGLARQRSLVELLCDIRVSSQGRQRRTGFDPRTMVSVNRRQLAPA